MPSRRDVLKAGGVTAAAVAAGSATRWGAWTPSVEAPTPGTWPQPRYGYGNTGRNPHATPPTDDPEAVRQYETSREVDALAVDSERVYAGTEHAVHAFGRALGESAWEATASARWVAVGGDTAVAAGENTITAFEAANGALRWRQSLDGFAYSLLVDADTAYVGTQERLSAFALDSGDRRWSISTGDSAFTGFDAGRLLLVGNGLCAYEPRSALRGVLSDAPTRTWAYTDLYDAGHPVSAGDFTLVGYGGGPAGATSSVTAVDAGEREWETTLGNNAGRIATDGERAYAVSVQYGETETVGGTTVNVPDDTTLYALDAATGETLWTFHRSGSFCAPVVANDTVYVGTYGNWEGAGDVHALDPASGAVRWSYSDTDGVNALAAVDDRLYAATTDGVLAFA